MNNDPHAENPLLLDHDYDGIRELDNKLPRWWVWLFNLSIVFAVGYMLHYHVLRHERLSIMQTEYKAEMELGNLKKAKAMTEFENKMPLLAPSKEPEVLQRGQTTFLTLCAPCHRKDGGGLVGPNLCDDYWIHGSNFVDNLTTIWNGVPAKGMVTWKNSLRPDQVYEVASFIYTLRGTNPKNPKPPENQTPAKTGPSEFE